MRNKGEFNGYSHVGDMVMLVTILGRWRQNKDLGDIFWMLVPDANVIPLLISFPHCLPFIRIYLIF